MGSDGHEERMEGVDLGRVENLVRVQEGMEY